MDFATLKNKISNLRDTAVTAQAIKTQTEERMKEKITEICNLIEDETAKQEIQLLGENFLSSPSSDSMQVLQNRVNAYLTQLNEANEATAQKITEAIAQWEEKINE